MQMNPDLGWNTQPLQQHQDGPAAITSPPADFVGTSTAESAPVVEPAAAPVVEPPAEAVVPVAEPDPFDDAKIDTFGRPYVEKLRQDAARARIAAKAGDRFKVFGDYDEASQAVWTDLATTFLTDPVKAAGMMEEIVAAVRAGATPAEAKAAVEADPNAAVTPESVREMIRKEQDAWQAERQLQDRTQAIVSEAKGLGYEPGTAAYAGLFHYAQSQTAGDLAAAHVLMQADRQAIIDSAMAAKAKTAGPNPVNQGPAAGTRTVPKTWAEASAAVRAGEFARAGE